MVSARCTISFRYLSVCLEILNSFNISGIDETTLFQFGKWIDYSKFHPKGKKITQKGQWFGSHDCF